MKKSRRGQNPPPKRETPAPKPPPSRRGPTLAFVGICVIAAAAVGWQFLSKKRTGTSTEIASAPPMSPTFNKDIAPIVFKNCAICHRPGQSAPFSLLTYADVKKHLKQIVDVTHRRYMPPWLPLPGYGDFEGTRTLSIKEIEFIRQWASEGAREGNSGDLPAFHAPSGDWALGQPDLVLEMPQSYTLPAEGRDVYRNFIVPTGLTRSRYVRALEFQPGNLSVVHHAFVKVDTKGRSRRLDAQDGQIGFPGMRLPDGVEMPDGHFLAWQPGKMPEPELPGTSWKLQPDEDLVIQEHLRTSGKPELVRSRIGLYFTDEAPTIPCTKLALFKLSLDIPPGEKSYPVDDEFVLPTDARILAVLPHAHYLCREMAGYATLPDGSRKWLLLITNWDFNWQGDYRYSTPIDLPSGTRLSMHYVYDNSTNNVSNPHNPPVRVRYGPQSSDEMAELWFQLSPAGTDGTKKLADAIASKYRQTIRSYNEFLLQLDPNDSDAQSELGFIRFTEHRFSEALTLLQSAVSRNPTNDLSHYRLGLVLRQQNRMTEAKNEFETVLKLNPQNADAHGNLGVIYAGEGNLPVAESHLRTAVQMDPQNPVAAQLLKDLLKAEGKTQ